MKRLVLLFACVALSGCTSLVERQEAQLDASGFKAFPADTPERKALLASLPSRQFVKGTYRDYVTYTYADPLVCNCLYVGSQQAYGAYLSRLIGHSNHPFAGGLPQHYEQPNYPM